MENCNFNKALKILATVALGNLSGVTVYKYIAITSALEEQENVPAAAKTMGDILKKSAMLPVTSMVCSASNIALYVTGYGTPQEDRFYLVAGVLMLCLTPYTIKMLLPINKQFASKDEETHKHDDAKWLSLFAQWKKWHLPRAILSASLFCVSVYKLTK